MHESDGIHEAISAQTRVLVTLGGYVAQAVAQKRAEALRRAEQESAATAEALHARLEHERSQALSSLAPVTREGWLESARPEEVAAAWRTCEAWRDDESIAAVRSHLAGELAALGIGPEDLATAEGLERFKDAVQHATDAGAIDRPAADAALLEASELHAIAEAEAALADFAAERGEHTGVTEHAHRAASAATDADLEYDTAERRAATAAALEHEGASPELVGAVMTADVSTAEPPSAATRTAGKSPKARKGGQQLTTQRTLDK